MSGPGPTTRQFVDADNNPVNSIGGQNANNDFVAGSTAHDITGNPIAVALDSSVQSVVSAISTSNSVLSSIQASATALVTASGTEITLLSEIFTVAGTLATDAHLVAQTAAIGAGNTTLSAIAASVAAGSTAAGQATASGYASTTATNTTAISAASGAPADVVYSGSGSGSIVSLLKWIGAKLSGTLAVSGTFWQATQPVSAAALPLPANAAQETGGNLAAILTKLSNVVLAAGAASIGAVTQAGTWLFSTVANTTGGVSTFSATGGTGAALLTNSAVAVKASAGNLYGFDFVNTGAADAYVQLFDVGQGGVTLGTTVPKLAKWVPAGGSWQETLPGEAKISFGTAITVAATTTPTGAAAPAAGILANILYK